MQKHDTIHFVSFCDILWGNLPAYTKRRVLETPGSLTAAGCYSPREDSIWTPRAVTAGYAGRSQADDVSELACPRGRGPFKDCAQPEE